MNQSPDRACDLCKRGSWAGSGACFPSTAAEANSCVWCHLHHLPEGVLFNMGPLLFHSALCCWWGRGYMCAISVLPCICLSVHVCVCVLMCLCEYVRTRESERTREKESVAMHFYTSSHWSLHMKNHGREKMNTHSWAIFLWCNNILAIKARRASAERQRSARSQNRLDAVRE